MKKKLLCKQTLRVSEMSVKIARHCAVKDCGNVDYALERWNKTHSKRKKRKILVRQKSIKTKKTKKNIPSGTWFLYSRENRPVVPIIWPVLHCQFLVAYSREVENIAYCCYNIVHENKKKKSLSIVIAEG